MFPAARLGWWDGSVPDALLDRWPLPEDPGTARELLAAYDGPTRGYHDRHHLTEVLDRIEGLRDAGADCEPLPVLLAAWFHDAVYDGERDAEERSATWAEAALAPWLPAAVVAEVARLVRLTETHRPAPGDRNGEVLSDADLGILAADPGRYAAYVAAVRREYAHLDDATFTVGRRHVLEQLLAKPSLFHTAPAIAAWERPARANVAAELSRLPQRD